MANSYINPSYTRIRRLIKTNWQIILTIVLFILSIGSITAKSNYIQSTRLSLNINNKTVQNVLDEIEKQSEFKFFYNNKQINTSRLVSIKSINQDVFKTLDQVFNGTDIAYKVIDRNIILSKKEWIDENDSTYDSKGVQQKNRKITGTVTDESGLVIIGASIIVKGTTTGTVTDTDGKFALNVPDKAVLKISFVGYVSQEVSLTAGSSYNIVLKENQELLDEVIVTALGIRREEKALGYAVQKVSGEALSTVKVVDVSTSLTGKIAGLNVKNNTEFNAAPSLELRGESPLLVIDGVPYKNMSLRDVAPDDIASVDVLKGATASALYGARGGAGAIMVTTKRGIQEGLTVTVNSSTMFNAGYLKKPEVQTAYSSGSKGRYRPGDYVWGDKLDIGRTADQYNPYTHQIEKDVPLVSKGKNNLKNFQQLSLITNNNISIAQKGKFGSVRSSFTHVYNKGQYPNEKLNKFTYTVSGEMKWNDFEFEGGLTYNKRMTPDDFGAGYGGGGFLYNLLVWSGSEFDIRDYKNYWVIPDSKQNWMDDTWYDNPYYIAHEITRSSDYDIVNGFLSASYNISPWLKATLRTGVESYSEKKQWKNPVGAVGGWSKNGYYGIQRLGGFSINNDFLLMANHTFGDFKVDGFIGGSMYYYQDDNILSQTKNGLLIPGYYSLKSSKDPATTQSSLTKKQLNSVYGKASVGWKSTVFLDVTGRNDWSSSLHKDTRSYFYPSVAGSVVLSQLFSMDKVLDFWKIRASWTKTKQDSSPYVINNAYSLSPDVWDGLTTAAYPTMIRDAAIKPSESRSYELGTAFHILNNKLRFDITYYNKLKYNQIKEAYISKASGFDKALINFGEEYVRTGVEVTITSDIISNKDFEWSAVFNWALDRNKFAKIDPVYSEDKPWIAKGERADYLDLYDWLRDPQGNIIHKGGFPELSNYKSVAGYKNPDWIWGLSNTFRYKDFTLGISIDGRVGGLAHSITDQALWNSGAHPDSDNEWRYDEVVNRKTSYIGQGVQKVSGEVEYDSYGNIISDTRVFAPNDVAVGYESYMLRMNPYIGSVRSQNVFSQTFFKLRDLSISYTLPKNLCKKIKTKGLNLALIGQNLLIWTKDFRFSDPDRGVENLNSPSIRYVGFNLKVDF